MLLPAFPTAALCSYGPTGAGHPMLRITRQCPAGSGYAGIPVFEGRGLYASAQSLTTTTYPAEQVRYTLTAVETSSSPLASGPITLNDTAITVRARVRLRHCRVLPLRTLISSVNSRLPVYSLTTDPDNLWDYNTGIYVEGPNADPNTPHWYANHWMDWEKPVTVEFFDRAPAGICVSTAA